MYLRMIRIYACLFLLILAGTSNSNAQDEVFRTIKGLIRFTGVVNDSVLIASSNQLVIVLDYENAKFILKLDKSTLRTGVDSLDKRLAKYNDDYIRFEGKLGIDYIQTASHPPQDFKVKGYLNCASHNEPVIGKGRLEHIFSDTYTCVLNMTFHINLKTIFFDIDLPGLEDEIQVEIVQTILNRGSD